MKDMIAKAVQLTAAQIKEWLLQNVTNTADEIMVVYDVMLSALETKISDAEFVVFASQLEAAL